MEVIKFRLKGLVNSLRLPQTAAYQNTELCPKKTHIAGLISNIMGKNEKFYYTQLLPNIKVGILPLSIDGLFVDLWQYKKWKESNIGGRAVVKREKLFHASYEIFISPSENISSDEIYNSLKFPERVPSLGMDDEMIEIKDVRHITSNPLKMINEIEEIHSIFPLENNMKYEFYLYENSKNKYIIPPRIVSTNLLFEFSIPRIPKKFINIVEFFGGYCKVSLSQNYPFHIIEYNGKNIVMW